jgi:hypothetical protein
MSVTTNAELAAHKQAREREWRARQPRPAPRARPDRATLLRLSAHAPCPVQCAAFPADPSGTAALGREAHARADAAAVLARVSATGTYMPAAGSLPAHRLGAPAASRAHTRTPAQLVAVPRGSSVTIGAVLSPPPPAAAAAAAAAAATPGAPRRWAWDDNPLPHARHQPQMQVKQVRFSPQPAALSHTQPRPAPWGAPRPPSVAVVARAQPQALPPPSAGLVQGGASALERTLPAGGVAALVRQR